LAFRRPCASAPFQSRCPRALPLCQSRGVCMVPERVSMRPFRASKQGCAWCQSVCPCALPLRQSRGVCMVPERVSMRPSAASKQRCARCQSGCPCALPLLQSKGVHGARVCVHAPFQGVKAGMCMVPERVSMRPSAASKQGCAWCQSGCPCAHSGRQSRDVHGARAGVHASFQGVKARVCMVPERVSMRPFRASKQGCAWCQSGCPRALSGRQSRDVHVSRAVVHAPFRCVKAGVCMVPEHVSMCPFRASKQGCARFQSGCPCALSGRQSKGVHGARSCVHVPFRCVKAGVCKAPDRVSMCPSAASKQGCAWCQSGCPCALPLRQRVVVGLNIGCAWRVPEWL